MRQNHNKIVCIKLVHLPYLPVVLLQPPYWRIVVKRRRCP